MINAYSMNLSDFDYHLPKERIAQHPAHPREKARLMVLPQKSEEIIHDHVGNLPSYFKKGDVVVINNTKVFKARLHATIRTAAETTKTIEVFLVKPLTSTKKISTWQALAKPGKVIKASMTIPIADDFVGTVRDKHSDGTIEVQFPYSEHDVIEKANTYGSVPTPPYIKEIPKPGEYQTVYAKKDGSVAAPTAGFHITKHILTQLKAKGVQIVEITLHVGLGTFLPIKSETIEEHTMHSEWVDLSQAACDTINQAKEEGRRVIAVGTTTVRTLEGVVAMQNAESRFQNSTKENSYNTFDNPQLTTHNSQQFQPFTGDVNLFITPGFQFNVIDGLLTNFHLPKSTLLLLVSAFAGTERIKSAYQEAVSQEYRFFSFGDAMLIL